MSNWKPQDGGEVSFWFSQELRQVPGWWAWQWLRFRIWLVTKVLFPRHNILSMPGFTCLSLPGLCETRIGNLQIRSKEQPALQMRGFTDITGPIQ